MTGPMPPLKDRTKPQSEPVQTGRTKQKLTRKSKNEEVVIRVGAKIDHQAVESAKLESEFLELGDAQHRVIRIAKTGNVILDVRFENTRACTKSIPSETIQKLKMLNSPYPSTRVFYRVSLDVLKQHSKYFDQLLGSDVFEEGRTISSKFDHFTQENVDPSTLLASELPKIEIVDEDEATRTMGRESIFQDMLCIMHGEGHSSKSITLLYLAILVVMADRYDCMTTVARYITSKFSAFRYPQTLEKTSEEVIRQKILVFYHTNQAMRFFPATKELISRGSSRWSIYEAIDSDFGAAWWDLPEDLEGINCDRLV